MRARRIKVAISGIGLGGRRASRGPAVEAGSGSVGAVRLERNEPTRVPPTRAVAVKLFELCIPSSIWSRHQQASAHLGDAAWRALGRPGGVINPSVAGTRKTAAMCAINPAIPPIQRVWSQSASGLKGTSVW
jgi:hypothetical protein